MIARFQRLVDESDRDLASFYVELAKQHILDYTNRKVLLSSMELLVIQLAINYYQKDKQGNITSRSEGAISESYQLTQDIPKDISSRLDNYRLLHGVKL